MIDDIALLYEKTLPDILSGDEAVRRVLSDEENHFIFRKENDKLIGVSVINEGTIYLLLVDVSYQGRAVGTSLLKESEEFIKSKGTTKITLGAGKDYIVPGVPMNNNAHLFFKKHGYHHSWGSEKCIDLCMNLSDYSPCGGTYGTSGNGDIIDGNLYRKAEEKDIEEIIRCCGEDDFRFHYSNKELYKPGSRDFVLIAQRSGEILGAVMVGVESDEKSIGYAGSIITAQKHRKKGIATNLMKLATNHLKDMGLYKAWLSYTYSAIAGMYEKLGYEICMEYFMGEKTAFR